jgi:hypothetical protein
MTAQGIGAGPFLMLLPEKKYMLHIFSNALCVNPERDVQNAHETMNELNHSNIHIEGVSLQSNQFFMIRIVRYGLQEAIFAAPDTATGVLE